MAKPREANAGAIWRHKILAHLRSISVQLYARGDFALMDQELQLPQMDQAWKLKHDLLWEHTETLTLPSDELTLVFP